MWQQAEQLLAVLIQTQTSRIYSVLKWVCQTARVESEALRKALC